MGVHVPNAQLLRLAAVLQHVLYIQGYLVTVNVGLYCTTFLFFFKRQRGIEQGCDM